MQALLHDKPRIATITANSELHLLVLSTEVYEKVLSNNGAKESLIKATQYLGLSEDFLPSAINWDAHLRLSGARQRLHHDDLDGRYQNGDLLRDEAEERADLTESTRSRGDFEDRLKAYGAKIGVADEATRSVDTPDLRGCVEFEGVNPEWFARLKSIGKTLPWPCVCTALVAETLPFFVGLRDAAAAVHRHGDGGGLQTHPWYLPPACLCVYTSPLQASRLHRRVRCSWPVDALRLLLWVVRCAGRYIGHGFQAHDFSADGAAEDLIVFVDRHFTRKVSLTTNVTTVAEAIAVLAPYLPNCNVIENKQHFVSIVSKNRGLASSVEILQTSSSFPAAWSGTNAKDLFGLGAGHANAMPGYNRGVQVLRSQIERCPLVKSAFQSRCTELVPPFSPSWTGSGQKPKKTGTPRRMPSWASLSLSRMALGLTTRRRHCSEQIPPRSHCSKQIPSTGTPAKSQMRSEVSWQHTLRSAISPPISSPPTTDSPRAAWCPAAPPLLGPACSEVPFRWAPVHCLHATALHRCQISWPPRRWCPAASRLMPHLCARQRKIQWRPSGGRWGRAVGRHGKGLRVRSGKTQPPRGRRRPQRQGRKELMRLSGSRRCRRRRRNSGWTISTR